MNGLNKAMLIGSLGMDPELKFTNGGQAVLRLRMATNESYQGKDGQRQEKVEWHTVTVWGKRAEALHKILQKGKTVYVEGRIQTRTWDDKDGNKRYATEINATEIILFSDGKGRPGNQQDDRGGHEQEAGGYNNSDEPLPF